jgi:hypothetical protein
MRIRRGAGGSKGRLSVLGEINPTILREGMSAFSAGGQYDHIELRSLASTEGPSASQLAARGPRGAGVTRGGRLDLAKAVSLNLA